jgi:hypothetical protein
MVEDITNICRSLGLCVTSRTYTPTTVFPHKKEYKASEQIALRIFGNNIDKIPTRVVRKQITRQIQTIRETIKVRDVGKGRYAGWTISGDTHRYLLGDGTVTHNCVECHTAFSWNTGEIEKGVIHNPHFYQWQRQQNGGVAPRVRGDVRCGGIPQIWEIESAIKRAGIDFPEVFECHRLIGHINHVVLLNYPNQPLGEDNTDLRIKYLMNELTDNAFISQLKKKEKKREKDLAINMVLTMFTGTLGDLFGNMLVIKPEEINNLIIQMTELRKYVNENLEKVRRRFKNKVPYICQQWLLKSK